MVREGESFGMCFGYVYLSCMHIIIRSLSIGVLVFFLLIYVSSIY